MFSPSMGDHRLGEVADDPLLLLGVEDALDELDVDQWHAALLGRDRRAAGTRTAACPEGMCATVCARTPERGAGGGKMGTTSVCRRG
jgi:hypothetical protein